MPPSNRQLHQSSISDVESCIRLHCPIRARPQIDSRESCNLLQISVCIWIPSQSIYWAVLNLCLLVRETSDAFCLDVFRRCRTLTDSCEIWMKLHQRSLTQSHLMYAQICVHVGACNRLSSSRLSRSMRNLKLLPKSIAILVPEVPRNGSSNNIWESESEAERLWIKEKKERKRLEKALERELGKEKAWVEAKCSCKPCLVLILIWLDDISGRMLLNSHFLFFLIWKPKSGLFENKTFPQCEN